MYWPHRARNTASVLKMKNLSDEKKQKTATPKRKRNDSSEKQTTVTAKRKRGEDSDNTLQKQKRNDSSDDEMIPESPNYQSPHDETLKDKREDMVSSSVQEGEQEVIF